MENIEKRIRSLVFEMVMIVCIIIGSYFVWDSFDYSREAQIAYAYSNYNTDLTVVINKNISALYPVEDESAKMLSPLNFTVNNTDKSKKEYGLYFKVNSQNTTLDIDYLKVQYKGETYSLKNAKTMTKDSNTYYLITKEMIAKKTSINNNMVIYLDIDTPDEEQNKTLSFSIYAEEI